MEECKLPIEVPYRIIGFSNTGNSCFLNAAMQIIKAIGVLRFLSEKHTNGICLQSIQESCGKTGRILEPQSSVWKVLELFLGYTPRAIRQNCACEFLRFFLVNLDEELDGLYRRIEHDDENWIEVSQRNSCQSFNFRARGKSVLYDLIGLCFKTEARAKGHSSITYQEELVIALQVEEKLSISLEKYFEGCSVESFVVNGVPTTCRAKSWISSFSPYLIFHIQRFKVEQGRVYKVKNFLQYPRVLKIPLKYLTPSLKLAVENGHSMEPEYELKGIVEHHGENTGSGHYTAVIQNGSNWVLADDHIVRPVSPEYVRNRNAYILLYQQVNRHYL